MSELSEALYHKSQSAEELIRQYEAGERLFVDIDVEERSDLSRSMLAGTTFQGGWLSVVDFRESDLRNVSFLGCNIKCSDFRDANLEGAVFKGSLMEATYFENASLTGASFAGAFAYGYELKDGEGPNEQGQF